MDCQTKLDLMFTGQKSMEEALGFLKKVPNPSTTLQLIEASLKASMNALEADIHQMNTQLMFEFEQNHPKR